MIARVSGNVYVRKRKGSKAGPQWYAKLRLDGRQLKRRIGPAWTGRGKPPDGFLDRRQAQAALEAILTDARRGLLDPKPKQPTGHTYEHACEAYLRYIEIERARAVTTVRGYRATAKRYLLPALGKDTPVSEITTEQIDDLRTELLTQGKLSRRSVQKVLVLNYGVLKLAKRRKWLDANPAEDAERVTLKRSGKFNVLSPEEVHALARAASNQQDAALYIVAAFTGLRMGELRALRWRDVDFASHTVHVRRNLPAHGTETEPKSGKVRSVPLIDQAARELDRLSRRDDYTQASDFVFANGAGRPLEDSKLRKRFVAALVAAGLGHKREEDPPLRFHDLRHTFGTLAVKVWDLRKVQGYMGHASITTTQGYMHHIPKATDALDLTRLVEGETQGDLGQPVRA